MYCLQYTKSDEPLTPPEIKLAAGDVNKFTAAIGHDMQVYFCCSNIGNPELAIGNLKTDSLQRSLSSLQRRDLINCLRREFCQQQCQNHKMNKIIHELTMLPRAQAEEMIREKQKEPRSIHCEFL